MRESRVAKLLETQKSLTEWLEDIKHKDVDTIRREDNDKRERLKVLHKLIGLPFDQPTQFEASELTDDNPRFAAYRNAHGQELCALRLLPKRDGGVPKLRMRGKTVADAYSWFKEQDVNAADYRADFVPHAPDDLWATIFIVNQHGVQGEIIFGGHHQLTQGFHDGGQRPLIFRYDFKKWTINPENDDALTYLKKLATYLKVGGTRLREKLHRELGATFAQNYLEGYFETTQSSLGTWFIDYSPTLGRLYADSVLAATAASSQALVSGQVGCAGTATGKVQVVHPHQLKEDFAEGAVLVCPVTTPQYVPLMQKAAAIVADQGGILSHAAIVARELAKPCIVGAENATKALLSGQLVRVDGNHGQVFGV
jgi:phosphohistidine swiveling domain-containing protein